jgi:hypothetical protein
MLLPRWDKISRKRIQQSLREPSPSAMAAIADWWSIQMGTVSIWLDRGAVPKRAASCLRRTPETPEDRAIRLEGNRISKAFPWIDFDHRRARKLRRA